MKMTTEKMIINVGSEGNAWSFGQPILRPLIEQAFPEFQFQLSKTNFQIYFRSHFMHAEPANNSKVPYIAWSGESYPINRKSYPPILDIVGDGEEGFHQENEVPTIYIPMLTIAYVQFESQGYQYPHYKNSNRPYCLAYCNSNPIKYREDFFKLAREKIGRRAHGLGRCSNTEGPTTGIWQSGNLVSTYSKYKFVMAFENLKKTGYITEKILTPFIAGAIPVFYGEDDMANKIFNPKAFIRVSDFDNIEDCINYLIELDKDEDRLNEIRQQPIFKDNKIPDILRLTDAENPYYKDVIDYIRSTLKDLIK